MRFSWLKFFAVGTLAVTAGGQAVMSPTVSGTDAGSGTAYALISLTGKVVGSTTPDLPPRLTAQCTKDAKGKLRFELLADAGGVGEVKFVAPFKTTRDQPFAPPVPRTTVTMEFLGYMKVKPVKRGWASIDGLPGEWKYATPGASSGNMEEVTFYLQYLKALPTLRLTLPGTSGPVIMEFETAAWQAKVKAEPLCWASTL